MLTRVEEIKLLAQCALADNRDAFGRLVEAYRADITRFLLNLTFGDAALSDDLAQEAFIKAYLSIRGFKGLSKFRTWLYRIAYNEYYAWLRRRHEERLDDYGQLAGSLSDPAPGNCDDKMDVQAAIRQLTDAQRAVVALFYIDDLPINKIAQITGMPTGTVKSHLSRAKAKLAQLLTNDETE